MYYKYLLAIVSGLCFCFTGVEAFAWETSNFQATPMSKVACFDFLSSLHFPSSMDSQRITQTPTPVSPSNNRVESSPTPSRPSNVSPAPTHPSNVSPAPTHPSNVSPAPTHPSNIFPARSEFPPSGVTLINRDSMDYDVHITSIIDSDRYISIGGGKSRMDVCSRNCTIQLGDASIDAGIGATVIIENGRLRKQ